MALGLGVFLGVGGLVSAWGYGIGGTERCATCDFAREVRVFGKLHLPASSEAATTAEPCRDHDWQRSGCWRTQSGFACYR